MNNKLKDCVPLKLKGKIRGYFRENGENKDFLDKNGKVVVKDIVEINYSEQNADVITLLDKNNVYHFIDKLNNELTTYYNDRKLKEWFARSNDMFNNFLNLSDRAMQDEDFVLTALVVLKHIIEETSYANESSLPTENIEQEIKTLFNMLLSKLRVNLGLIPYAMQILNNNSSFQI